MKGNGTVGQVLAATDYGGIAIVITALGTFVGVVISSIVTLRGQQRIKDRVEETHALAAEVKQQVITLNEGTVGSFAAEDETRRIEAIPREQRTPTEQRHIDQSRPPEPPQGPGR